MIRIITAAFRVFAADAADHHGSASAVDRRVTAAPIHRSLPPSDRSARLYSRWRRDMATGRLECIWLIDHATRAGSTNVIGRLSAITGASVLVFVGGPRHRASARSAIPQRKTSAAHEIGHGEKQPGTILAGLDQCASLRPLRWIRGFAPLNQRSRAND
jgi:hypothetical protein